MRTRKTVQVEALLGSANSVLRWPGLNADHRQGVITMLEFALLDANRYKGFRYLTAAEVGPKDLPGIRAGVDHLADFSNTDHTRREYF